MGLGAVVKQADGWESGMSALAHRRWRAKFLFFAEIASCGDRDALEAEYHEACAEGRTTAAEEGDHE